MKPIRIIILMTYIGFGFIIFFSFRHYDKWIKNFHNYNNLISSYWSDSESNQIDVKYCIALYDPSLPLHSDTWKRKRGFNTHFLIQLCVMYINFDILHVMHRYYKKVIIYDVGKKNHQFRINRKVGLYNFTTF